MSARFLVSPKWLLGHVLILVLGVTFVALGFWQLDRREELRLSNAVNKARIEADPSPLLDLVTQAGEDYESLEFRRVTVRGEFVPEEEVLLRSQVLDTRAGFHVLTPMRTEEGPVVMVNRGWVPLDLDRVPVIGASPPLGASEIEGIVRLGQSRSGTGHDDFAAGEATTVSRVDLDGLDPQVSGDLVPVYVEAVGAVGPTELPIPVSPPDFTDEGPHLDYALQWFGFALIAVLGYGFLIRRARRRRQA